MSEVATYALEVDWDGDGDYLDAGEDITADLVSCNVRRGFGDPLARMPSVGTATFLLNNQNRQYSPAVTATVSPRRKVRWSMTYGGTTARLYTGYLDEIAPAFGQYGARQVQFQCVDDVDRLDQHDGEIPLLVDVYADEVIETAITAAYLPDSPPTGLYQQGLNFFPTSSPGWDFDERRGSWLFQQAQATQKIRDAAMSDWGRFFIAGDGTPTFYNRHQMALDTSVELTLDNTMLSMQYSLPSAIVRNYVEVTCYPRSVGTVFEILGQLSQSKATTIEASGSITLVIPFRDPANAAMKLGGLSVITPIATTDYTCTSDPEGEGDDETANVTAAMTDYADRAEIVLTNTVARPVHLQSLRVRGLAVRAAEPITVVAQDATSITAYGKRKLAVDAQLLSDPGAAQLLANYLLAYYRQPLNQVRGVEILANSNATWMAAVRDLELCDLVSITEEQTGLSGWHGFVGSLTHNYVSRYEHRLILDLEQAYTIAGTPFRIGVSALNSGHVLVY